MRILSSQLMFLLTSIRQSSCQDSSSGADHMLSEKWYGSEETRSVQHQRPYFVLLIAHEDCMCLANAYKQAAGFGCSGFELKHDTSFVHSVSEVQTSHMEGANNVSAEKKTPMIKIEQARVPCVTSTFLDYPTLEHPNFALTCIHSSILVLALPSQFQRNQNLLQVIKSVRTVCPRCFAWSDHKIVLNKYV